MRQASILTLLAVLLALGAAAQPSVYVTSLTGTLAGSGASLTVQNPAHSTRAVTVMGFYVACASCTATASRTGAAATATVNPMVAGSSTGASAVSQAFANSGVSAGTTIAPYPVTGEKTVPFVSPAPSQPVPAVVLPRAAAAVDNFTVTISSMSGAYTIIIQVMEN